MSRNKEKKSYDLNLNVVVRCVYTLRCVNVCMCGKKSYDVCYVVASVLPLFRIKPNTKGRGEELHLKENYYIFKTSTLHGLS